MRVGAGVENCAGVDDRASHGTIVRAVGAGVGAGVGASDTNGVAVTR